MSIPLGSVGAVGSEDETSKSIELRDMQIEERQERMEREAFNDVATEAINSAVDRPGADTGVTTSRKELLDGADGAVGERRNDLVSDVTPFGVAEKTPDSNENAETLEDRVMTLYEDLTSYQVAWRIAQKIPQDVSQILKGS